MCRIKEKQQAGEKAAEYVRDGMVVGLGTGSTVFYTIRKIVELVKNGMKIQGVSTSKSTTELAGSLGIELVSINDVETIDLTIDGADEIDQKLNGIKGGGGALFFEKVVAYASAKVIWVVDAGKMAPKLGGVPVPVEVSPFGYRQVYKRLSVEGLNPVMRLESGQPFRTDSDHYILDLYPDNLDHPGELGAWLKEIPGVIEHGLFIDCAAEVLVGRGDSVVSVLR
ncbi:ribose-5-phosphate isomerase RpiA [Desulfitobacterium chlororespirans]|nr:ribose-5-phosphate isomerase RpiA [Desulfitobacterium chlororespirans]